MNLDAPPPGPGVRFRPDGRGALAVAQLIVIADDQHHPKSYLVRADDGAFWSLVRCDGGEDGIAFTGTKLRATGNEPRTAKGPTV